MSKLLYPYGGKSVLFIVQVVADEQIMAYLASIFNSTVRDGGLFTNTIEWGHIDDAIRWVVKMKLPFEDFYRILAKEEAYKEAGWDSANIIALQKLRDFDDNEERKDHYNLTKLALIKKAHGMSWPAPKRLG